MSDAIEAYLQKRTRLADWTLQGAPGAPPPSCVVVIPALAESSCLFDTLHALAASADRAGDGSVSVIVVVNNRPAGIATPDDIADNTQTLSQLAQCSEKRTLAHLHIGWVDASSPGHELPQREGVGFARKLGADHALAVLRNTGNIHAPIIHLDADSPPAPDYVAALLSFYGNCGRWGGWCAYRHCIPHPASPEGRAMTHYEIYMRHHALALRYARSPYAYPALGSIMSSTAKAYAAAGGMNRRCAGEDFYFMQQLVKTGSVEAIPGALVHPSGRISTRTPFGTGQVIAAGAQEAFPHEQLFNPCSYQVLKEWLALAASDIVPTGEFASDKVAAIHPELLRFLHRFDFAGHWSRIAANHKDPLNRLRQFHNWFDGLRTIQLIHHLRDTAFPDVPAETAVGQTLAMLGASAGCNAPRTAMELLAMLRDTDRPLEPC